MWAVRCLNSKLTVSRAALLTQRCTFRTSRCSPFPSTEVPDLSFTDYVLENTATKEERLAIIDDKGRAITYAELKERTMDLAIHFFIRGWKKQAVIALFMPNVFEWALTFLSAAKAGMIVTPVDTAALPTELERQLRDSKATYIITTQALLPVVREVTASLRGIKEVLVLDKDADDIPKTKEGYIRYTNEMKYNLLFNKPPAWGSLPDWEVNPDDPVLLPYTPSPSGVSKAVVLTHRNLVASIEQSISASSAETSLVSSTVPFHRVFGVIIPLSLQFRIGSTVYLTSSKPEEALPLFSENNVTHTYMQPADLEEVVGSQKFQEVSLPSLSKVTLLATSNRNDPVTDSVDPKAITGLKEKLPSVKVTQTWGMTETSSVGTILEVDTTDNMMTLGCLAPNTKAVVLDSRGREVEAIPAEGQICLKGPQVMSKYLNNTEEGFTVKREDGFLETGFIGKINADGLISIYERKKPKATLPSE